MNLNDLKIGDIILSRDGVNIELHITSLDDEWMIDNEIDCLINNNGCCVYRLVEKWQNQ